MLNNRIKLAINDLLWGLPDEEGVEIWLKEAKQIGYQGISLLGPVVNMFINKPAQFDQLLNKYKLGLASVSLKWNTEFDVFREAGKRMNDHGCTSLIIGLSKKEDITDLSQRYKRLEDIGRIMSEYKINVGFHHHTDHDIETYTELVHALSETDKDLVKLFVDTGHATKDFVEFTVKERAIKVIENYWDRTYFIEFKDWNSDTDLNTPIGEGDCDFEHIFRILKDKKYSSWITVEQNGHAGLSKGRSSFECAQISYNYISSGLFEKTGE